MMMKCVSRQMRTWGGGEAYGERVTERHKLLISLCLMMYKLVNVIIVIFA
jgi:hypothetical protein